MNRIKERLPSREDDDALDSATGEGMPEALTREEALEISRMAFMQTTEHADASDPVLDDKFHQEMKEKTR